MSRNWNILQEAIKFVNSHGIDVDFRGSATDIGSPYSVNGCAFVEQDLIDLYADDPVNDADMLTACLIHEFGHIMDYAIYGGGDDEEDAWKVGVKLFPKWLVPKCLPAIKKKCLAHYAQGE
jgi:hypothetical protein